MIMPRNQQYYTDNKCPYNNRNPGYCSKHLTFIGLSRLVIRFDAVRYIIDVFFKTRNNVYILLKCMYCIHAMANVEEF